MSASVWPRMAVLALLVQSAVTIAGYGHSPPTPSISPDSAQPSNSQDSSIAGSCVTGFVYAMVGDQSKCLTIGSRCQQQWASDYARYGFVCTKHNRMYTLNARSN